MTVQNDKSLLNSDAYVPIFDVLRPVFEIEH